MKTKTRKKLDLSGLNVEALVGNSAKAAMIFGLIDEGEECFLVDDLGSNDSTSIKRVFRPKALYISR